MAATESIAHMRKLRNHMQNGCKQVPVDTPTSRVSVVWKHFSLETDDSAQRKPRNLYAMQAEGCPWQRHNQFVPSSHEASFDIHTMSTTRRLRESSFETFVRSAEVKEVPPHSRCSTTVNWLTDSYW